MQGLVCAVASLKAREPGTACLICENARPRVPLEAALPSHQWHGAWIPLHPTSQVQSVASA